MIKGRKILYQIGERDTAIIVPRTDIKTSVKKSADLKIQKSPFNDGDVDLSGVERNPLSGRTITVDFTLTEGRYSIDYLNQALYNEGLVKVFFISPSNNNQEVRIFWNYARIVGGINDLYDAGEGTGEDAIPISLELHLTFPYYFEDDDRMRYIDTTVTGDRVVWGDSAITYGQAGIDYGVTTPGLVNDLSTLTQQERYDRMWNCAESDVSLLYDDIWFASRTGFLSSPGVSVSPNTANNINTDQVGLDLNTSVESRFTYLTIGYTEIIPLPPIFGFIFQTGEYIEVYNENTNTGFRLDWIGDSVFGSLTNIISINLITLEVIRVGSELPTVPDGTYPDKVFTAGVDYNLSFIDGNATGFLSFSARLQDDNLSTMPTASGEDFVFVNGTSSGDKILRIISLKTFT